MTPTVNTAPKVSVCVITYNQKHYIGDCLQSLVDQATRFPFEILVGDDCSTDGTTQIVQAFVQRYPGRIRLLCQPVNSGGSRNNNELHAAARGDYVAHVDGDDVALPGKLQAQADALDRDAQCTAVWHRVDFFDDAGGFCSGSSADWRSFNAGIVSFADAIQLGYVSVFSSLMYRRSARTPVDPGRRLLDLHWTWDLLSKGHGRALQPVLGRYRVSSSGSLTQASRLRVQQLAIEHAGEMLARFPERQRDFFIWAASSFVIETKNRRGSTAREHLRFALRCAALVRPGEILANLRRLRAIQVQWRHQRSVVTPAVHSTVVAD